MFDKGYEVQMAQEGLFETTHWEKKSIGPANNKSALLIRKKKAFQ